MSRRLSAEERQALSELNRILSETPQWSGEEELRHDRKNIGGRVRFCHFWDEHYSMVQLTEDCNGKYSTAYVKKGNDSCHPRNKRTRPRDDPADGQ